MPKTRLNDGDFRFRIKTREVFDGWVGVVYINRVVVYILPVPRRSRDSAYSATRRAVDDAFRNLVGSTHRETR